MEKQKLMPVVDFNRCETKGPCIEVCPYDVFEMQAISKEAYAALSFIGKMKTFVHGREKAIVARPGDCASCGLCVKACPEKAIKLTKYLEQ